MSAAFALFLFQLRLDFDSFVIAGPSTETAVSTHLHNGSPLTHGVPASVASQCLTDSFVVTGDGGGRRSSDVICGVNTGQHCQQDDAPLL